MEKVVDTFLSLVKIDSPSGDEKTLSLHLKKYLSDLGFSVKVDALGQILASSSSNRPLLVTAHLDTVEPGRGIKTQIVGGFIRSDGTTILGADNKASIAPLLIAVEEYKALHHKLPEIEILFSVKEETGGGIDQFPFEWIKAKKGITFDLAQPIGKIAIQAPFIYNFKATFTGKAAHSSRPEAGKNSLLCASSFVNHIPVGRVDQDSTVNVGKIYGGTGINTIPEQTVAEGEVRSANIKTFNLLLKKIKNQAIKTSTQFNIKLSFKLSGFCPGYKYSKDDHFINKVSKILTDNKYKVELLSSTGVSDANIIADKKIKLVCLSDGVENPHTISERISIKNLVNLKHLILDFISKAPELTQ